MSNTNGRSNLTSASIPNFPEFTSDLRSKVSAELIEFSQIDLLNSELTVIANLYSSFAYANHQLLAIENDPLMCPQEKEQRKKMCMTFCQNIGSIDKYRKFHLSPTLFLLIAGNR